MNQIDNQAQQQALQWIVQLLNQHNICYAICGGLAANFYGSSRSLNDIDLFVADKDFPTVVTAAKDFISKPAQHYCEAAESWDLQYVQFIYQGVKIEVGNAKDCRIYHAKQKCWQPLIIDFQSTVTGQYWQSTISVIAKQDLIAYKSVLARAVDLEDIQAIDR